MDLNTNALIIIRSDHINCRYFIFLERWQLHIIQSNALKIKITTSSTRQKLSVWMQNEEVTNYKKHTLSIVVAVLSLSHVHLW